MNYRDFVASKKKSGADIADSITPIKADALHMAIGVSSDAGELLDAIKKWVIYNKPLDRANVIEELGDIEFFLEGLRQCLEIDRDETIFQNMAKLDKRYAGGYTDEEAQTRKDKL